LNLACTLSDYPYNTYKLHARRAKLHQHDAGADGEFHFGECAATTATFRAAGVEQNGELRLQIHGGTRERRDGSDRDESGSQQQRHQPPLV
jgi:hypothetical protein